MLLNTNISCDSRLDLFLIFNKQYYPQIYNNGKCLQKLYFTTICLTKQKKTKNRRECVSVYKHIH